MKLAKTVGRLIVVLILLLGNCPVLAVKPKIETFTLRNGICVISIYIVITDIGDYNGNRKREDVDFEKEHYSNFSSQKNEYFHYNSCYDHFDYDRAFTCSASNSLLCDTS